MLLYLVPLLLVLVGITIWAGVNAKARLKGQHPPPGQLVDVGGHALHIYCQGEGVPAVVMEAGGGSLSLTWALVQPEVARTTRVCVYDRAGFGWSDPDPRPPTAQHMVEGLHTLLGKSAIQGPYVLVGHSMGGMLMRLYAHQHPEQVVGMVLVDSVHEEQALRFPEPVRQALSILEGQTQRQLGFFSALAAAGIIALDPSRVPVHAKLPQAVAKTHQALLASDEKFFRSLRAEVAASTEISAEVRAAGITTLGNMPLIVLSHGKSDLLPPGLHLSSQALQQFESAWQQLQSELAALSPCGKRIVAEQSGHFIQLDQPELVIGAILQVVNGVRNA
ncbi:MAG: alpha/beta hydrolase [Acidobacteria bacterium]|nr:alpha/beta hydrolase [Acidobacteriota bacterium]